MQDFNAIFDSINAITTPERENQEDDLTKTIQFKLLTICGNLVKINKKSVKQVAWVRYTRSVEISTQQKAQLAKLMSDENHRNIAEDPNLMTIAIEFRLKPLV